jgi:hypothetical protein
VHDAEVVQRGNEAEVQVNETYPIPSAIKHPTPTMRDLPRMVMDGAR